MVYQTPTDAADREAPVETSSIEPSCDNDSTESATRCEDRFRAARTIAACACAAIAAFGLAAACLTATFNSGGGGEPPDQNPPADLQRPAAATAEKERKHVWVPVYGIEHTEAVTQTVEVAPTYETRTTAHTVCNDCLAVIDGAAQQHLDETGHSGFTPDVPVTDEVMTDEGGVETVVVKEGTDELVVTGEKCALCGEEREAPSDGDR